MKLKNNKFLKTPKKAKLIASGGFYRIIPIKKLDMEICVPISRRLLVNTVFLDNLNTFSYVIKFHFNRIHKGYAEYVQYDCVELSHTCELDKQDKK